MLKKLRILFCTALLLLVMTWHSVEDPIYADYVDQTASLKAVLIVWDEVQQSHDLFDSVSNKLLFTRKLEKGCWWDVVPASTSVICTDVTGSEYFMNLVSGIRRSIPLKNVDLLGWDAIGRRLVFQSKKKSENNDLVISDMIFVFDDATGQVLSYTVPISLRESLVSSELRLSPSGTYLAMMTDRSHGTSWTIFGLSDQGMIKLRDYGSAAEPVSPDFEWSSVSNQFVYGVTPTEYDVFVPAEKIVLGDSQSSLKRIIANSMSTDQSFWEHSFEWSPTSAQLLVGLWDSTFQSKPVVCVISIVRKSRYCRQAMRGVNGRFASWSPNGREIAYVDLSNKINVATSSFSHNRKISISVPENFALYWREIR